LFEPLGVHGAVVAGSRWGCQPLSLGRKRSRSRELWSRVGAACKVGPKGPSSFL
jgi:hypothetical protein